ncbi:MAG: MarR family transcriptional regulator [Tabrizicola sp.]|nr:MarR family transcriptional regulator [Tabrizicola sp.]
MTKRADDFDLEGFLPYLLNQAAEATSRAFQAVYRDRYGMTRTQWRVLAHLGQFGDMTARDICARSHIEKTKVSRAVAALEAEGMLTRAPSPEDGRAEILSLTRKGRAAYAALGALARAHDRELRGAVGAEASARLDEVLRRLIDVH